MRPNNTPLFSAVAASSSQTSNVMWVQDAVRTWSQVVVGAGTSNGTLQLQASADIAVGKPPNQYIPTNWSNIGSSVTVNAAGVYQIPSAETECCFEYLRMIYTDVFVRVGTIVDVADVAGSLNNTYFLVSPGSGTQWYLWFNVNSAGTDPAIVGKTGIEVDLATGATAAAVGTAIRAAMNGAAAFAAVFTVGGATVTTTITSITGGIALTLTDGAAAAATGFTLSATAPTSSFSGRMVLKSL